MFKKYTEETWESVQSRFKDVPGAEGIELRRREYAPFFLRFGRGVVIEEGCRFYSPQHIVLDDDVRINVDALMYGSGGIFIGAHARVGPRVFIHSANHDVSQGSEKAFHERGYEYRSVVVGANVLISANVSILPGAALGPGSFIACGAVVPGKPYPQGAHLYGMPASDRRPDNAPAITEFCAGYELAFVVPADAQGLYEAAQLLVEALGIPQLCTFFDGETLPRNIHTVITFPGVSGEFPDKNVWSLTKGEVDADCGDSEISALSVQLADANVKLPRARWLHYQPIGDEKADLLHQMRAVLFWLENRLEKRSSLLTISEAKEWIVAIYMTIDYVHKEDQQYIRALLFRILRKWPKGLIAPRDNIETLSSESGKKLLSSWFQLLRVNTTDQRFLFGATNWFNFAGLFSSIERKDTSRQGLMEKRKFFLLSPADLIWYALEDLSEDEREDRKALLREITPHCNTSLRLVCLSIAADILQDDATRSIAEEKLIARNRWPKHGAFPYQLPGKSALLLTPLLLIWFLRRHNLNDFRISSAFDVDRKVENLHWSGFSTSVTSNWSGNGNVTLCDEERRCISLDLFESWLRLQRSPCSSRQMIELSSISYETHLYDIENCWKLIFQSQMREMKRPLIEIKPWPAPYSAALSIRYDVDRAVSTKRVAEVCDIQKNYANAACGSWYFRSALKASKGLELVLERYNQELGVHAETTTDLQKGAGTTHHSAPTSLYWQGDLTTRSLEKVGALYGEYLSHSLLWARHAWLSEPDDSPFSGRKLNVALTPIHFPLEGGTSDGDRLAYFDRLVGSFRNIVSNGGHAIIGSHPDLDQAPLVRLLKRENLACMWKVSVEKAVQRCLSVMSPGKIKIMSRDDDSSLYIISEEVVHDLALEIVWPDGRREKCSTQLQANVPRKLIHNTDVLSS